MPLNALMNFSNSTKGESRLAGYEGWIEIQGWDWEVEADTSWTKGGGASVGKPQPGKMNWEHYYDSSSPQILRFICSGTMFDKVTMKMFKSTGAAVQTGGGNNFFTMDMEGCFITKVTNSATEDGNVLQKVEMVFKVVTITYKAQGGSGGTGGTLGAGVHYSWDIPAGKVG